jgi:hypothetical protein
MFNVTAALGGLTAAGWYEPERGGQNRRYLALDPPARFGFFLVFPGFVGCLVVNEGEGCSTYNAI